MFTKDRRRGERRWRSWCKFIRRLKSDWRDHGRNWSPRSYALNLGNSPAKDSPWRWTTLCPCFYDPKAQARFKDTPTLGHSQRACNGKEGDKLNRLKAERLSEVVREAHGKVRRERRKGRLVWIHKACIRCGVSLGRRAHIVGQYDTNGRIVCVACEVKDKRPLTWINGRLVGS